MILFGSEMGATAGTTSKEPDDEVAGRGDVVVMREDPGNADTAEELEVKIEVEISVEV